MYTKANKCDNCDGANEAIKEIDCKIVKMAKLEYSNIIYGFNKKPMNFIISQDLLIYKRIILSKLNNSDYLSSYSMNAILGRVRMLLNK